MNTKTKIKQQKLNLARRITRFAYPVSLVGALLIGAPAFAHELDTPFYLAARNYAVLKRMSIACDMPEDAHREYRRKMLAIISQVEQIDLSSARRAITNAYETDADLGGLDCTESLKMRYNYIIERGLDSELPPISTGQSA